MLTHEVKHWGRTFRLLELFNLFTVPEEGNYGRMLYDHETSEWDYKPRIGLNPNRKPIPATVPLWNCKPDDFIPMNEVAQKFWFRLIEIAAQGTLTSEQLKQAWVNGTVDKRALTDRHAAFQADENGNLIPIPGGHADYIMGVNLESPKGPLCIKCLDMAGNIIHIMNKDRNYYYFECLDLDNLPDPEEALMKPWLVHWATESTAIQLPGKNNWQVSKWPQLKRFGVPVGFPFPLIGPYGINKVRKNRVRSIANGAVFSPYNPETA